MRSGDKVQLGETTYANPDGKNHEVFKKTNCALLSLEVSMNERMLELPRVEADPPTMYGHTQIDLPEKGSRVVKNIGPVTAECVHGVAFKFIKKTRHETAAAPSVNESYVKTVVQDVTQGKKDRQPTSAKPAK